MIRLVIDGCWTQIWVLNQTQSSFHRRSQVKESSTAFQSPDRSCLLKLGDRVNSTKRESFEDILRIRNCAFELLLFVNIIFESSLSPALVNVIIEV